MRQSDAGCFQGCEVLLVGVLLDGGVFEHRAVADQPFL